MKLYLSGGSGRAFSLDKKFIKAIDKTKPMLYIPIAIDSKKHPFPECLKWIKGYFSELGFNNIEMLTNLRKFSSKSLEKFGSVYIGGGNTPYLLKELKESGFYEHLKTLIKKDIPIAGGSAGAIIFAKTIIPSLSADKNKVGLKDFSALNKIKGYNLWAHYVPEMDSTILNFMKKYNLKKVIALPEYTGIEVDNKKITFFGEKSGFIFDKKIKREIEVGGLI